MPRKVLLSLLLVLLIVPIYPVYAENLVFDGKRIDDNMLILEGKVMVPLRPVLEELDYQLSFDATAGLIVASKAKEQIEIYLGQPMLLLNGQEMVLLAAPQLVSGKTLLAAQDVCTLLNLKGAWESGEHSYGFVSIPKMTEEGVIGHLLAADRQMLRAIYYNNQDFLVQNSIAASPVLTSKEDLKALLSKHWSDQLIDELWQAGSREGRYEGFYSEGPIPLSYNKEMALQKITTSIFKVTVLMPPWEGEATESFEERSYTLALNDEGNLVVLDVDYKN